MQIRKWLLNTLGFMLVAFCVKSDTTDNSFESAFNDLKKMTGRWKIKNSDSAFRIDFELTANETVLIETWITNGKKKSLTLYHLDGKRLIATHYCPQGNQPRLEMINYQKSKKIEFKYFDATNLKSIDDSHQHYLAFNFAVDNNTIERSERYVPSDDKSLDILKLERVPEDQQ